MRIGKEIIWNSIYFQRNEESIKQTGIKLYETDLYIGKSRQKETGRISERRRNVKKKLLNGDIGAILYEDEAMIRDYQAIMSSWFLKGKQRKIRTYGKHDGVKLVGYLDYETGQVYVEEHKKYDAKTFLQFLKNVLKNYPEGKIVMILDNARIHHAILLQDFLKENQSRLQLVFLPPYSPNLNKIEGLWKWLKNSVVNNVFFNQVSEIKIAVQKFITWVNTVPYTVIDRLCVW